MGKVASMIKSQDKRRKTPRCLAIYFVVLVATLAACSVYLNYEPSLINSNGQAKRSTVTWYGDIFKNIEKLLPSRTVTSPSPVILFWTKYFSSEDWLPKLQDIGCQCDCNFTYDRRLVTVSSAVLFHLRDVDVHDLPDQKLIHQKWAFYNKEAPPNTPGFLVQALNGKIDWTITYRRDSDIFSPYSRTMKLKSNTPNGSNSSQGLRPKEHIVCWIVSNSATSSRREAYVKVLKTHIPVTVYGRGGDIKCPTSDAMECYRHIANNCKFYLSFENSICKDYVTEKAFNALRTDMVPIVMGGADYVYHMPPNSYINALDFREPKDLASYLKELDADYSKFQQYHQWKTEYYIQSTDYLWACDLCTKLQTPDQTPSPSSQDLQSWWFDEANCRSWIEYLDQKPANG